MKIQKDNICGLTQFSFMTSICRNGIFMHNFLCILVAIDFKTNNPDAFIIMLFIFRITNQVLCNILNHYTKP